MSFRRVVVLAAALAAGTVMAQDATQPPTKAASAATTASATGKMAPQPPPANAASAPALETAPADTPPAPTPGRASTAGTPAAPTSVGTSTPLPPLAGDAKAGQAKAAVCGACHGMDGNSTDPQYPKLAGQNEPYIVRQLTDFKNGTRQNPIMMGFAAALSPQDMHDVGAYFATQHSRPGVADEALVKQGKKLFREGDASRDIPACMSCHGPDGHGNPGAVYPQIASQHADYIQTTLKAWHDGTTWGKSAHAEIMPAIAERLDSKDIAALSSYLEGLHTNEKTATSSTP